MIRIDVDRFWLSADEPAARLTIHVGPADAADLDLIVTGAADVRARSRRRHAEVVTIDGRGSGWIFCSARVGSERVTRVLASTL